MPRVVIDPAVPDGAVLDKVIARLRGLDLEELQARWHTAFRRRAPSHLPRHLLFRVSTQITGKPASARTL